MNRKPDATGVVIWTSCGPIYSSASMSNKKEKTRKINQKRHLLYEIFMALSLNTEDNFWKERFQKYAKNMFPDHFNFVETSNISGNLFYKMNVKTKQDSIFIDENNLDSIKVIEFLNKKGIYSPEDERKLMEKRIKEEKIEYDEWSKVKNKYLRTSMIIKYHNKLSSDLNLNDKQKYLLKLMLNIGFISTYFNNTNVILENNEIKDITTLKFENNTFQIDTSGKIKKAKSNIKKKKKYASNTYTFNNITNSEEETIKTFNRRYDPANVWSEKVKEMIKKYNF